MHWNLIRFIVAASIVGGLLLVIGGFNVTAGEGAAGSVDVIPVAPDAAPIDPEKEPDREISAADPASERLVSIPAKRVLYSESDATEYAFYRTGLTEVETEDVVVRLVTLREFFEDFLHGGRNFDMPGAPDPDEPVWLVGVVTTDSISGSGFMPSRTTGQYAGTWLAYYARNSSGVGSGMYSESLRKHEAIKALPNRDLEITPGVITRRARPGE